MKRVHIHVRVADLTRSAEFYRHLFGREPDVLKTDYAKWMLDDPRLNLAISQSARARGVDHVGVQAETVQELEEIQQRLQKAGEQTADQPVAECCYARSAKTWVRDPDAVAWEAFVTHGEFEHYGADAAPTQTTAAPKERCCA